MKKKLVILFCTAMMVLPIMLMEEDLPDPIVPPSQLDVQ